MDLIIIISEIILMGTFATLFMDLIVGFLIKKNIIQSFITPQIIGRWFLYMFRGKFIHQNIYKTPFLENEKLWCFISHYLIGIFLAGVYLIIQMMVPIVYEYKWMPLMFGVLTIILPWFWLLPSMGLGFIALKSPNQTHIIKANIVNHFLFGLGMLIWIIIFHDLFI